MKFMTEEVSGHKSAIRREFKDMYLMLNFYRVHEIHHKICGLNTEEMSLLIYSKDVRYFFR